MIQNHDRSGWFGASHSSYIIGNRKTESWRKWWLVKLGIAENTYSNKAMRAGTAFEHRILDTIPEVRKDHQILIPSLHLRVNYDGDKDGTIYEVKTYNADKRFRLSKGYWRQAQAEMYAMDTTELYIVAYGLTDRDYKNYFAEIDSDRITYHKIQYDPEWIENEYLPNLIELGWYLERGRMPA